MIRIYKLIRSVLSEVAKVASDITTISICLSVIYIIFNYQLIFSKLFDTMETIHNKHLIELHKNLKENGSKRLKRR